MFLLDISFHVLYTIYESCFFVALTLADVRAFLIAFFFSWIQIRAIRLITLRTIVPVKSSNFPSQFQIGSSAAMYPIKRDTTILHSMFSPSLSNFLFLVISDNNLRYIINDLLVVFFCVVLTVVVVDPDYSSGSVFDFFDNCHLVHLLFYRMKIVFVVFIEFLLLCRTLFLVFSTVRSYSVYTGCWHTRVRMKGVNRCYLLNKTKKSYMDCIPNI